MEQISPLEPGDGAKSSLATASSPSIGSAPRGLREGFLQVWPYLLHSAPMIIIGSQTWSSPVAQVIAVGSLGLMGGGWKIFGPLVSRLKLIKIGSTHLEVKEPPPAQAVVTVDQTHQDKPPTSPQTMSFYEMGLDEFRKDHFKEALSIWEEARKMDPAFWPAAANAAVACLKLERWDEAYTRAQSLLNEYRSVADRRPYARALNMMGRAMEGRIPHRASKAFRKAECLRIAEFYESGIYDCGGNPATWADMLKIYYRAGTPPAVMIQLWYRASRNPGFLEEFVATLKAEKLLSGFKKSYPNVVRLWRMTENER